jgi:predicted transcriptional regulator
MKKTVVQELVSSLPEEISLDEIIERLIVAEKIERGRRDIREGKVNTEDEARKKLGKWLS